MKGVVAHLEIIIHASCRSPLCSVSRPTLDMKRVHTTTPMRYNDKTPDFVPVVNAKIWKKFASGKLDHACSRQQF